METELGMVPIGNFVTSSAEPKIAKINLIDQLPVVTVKSEVADGILPDTKVRELRAWLENEADLPDSVFAEFKGEDEDMRESEGFLMKAFGVALFIMAIILVTQFNSFYSAFLILSAVIMSTIGVMIGLLVTGAPFGVVMSGIGVIALAGIVVNNNIVLIYTYDTLRLDNDDPMDAILRTGAQRLRPVMLTTVTTILGLMPMVLQLNIDFTTRAVTLGAPSTQWWAGLSSAIVWGLGFATILTLFVTPAALMFKANISTWIKRRRNPAGPADQTDTADTDTRLTRLPDAAE